MDAEELAVNTIKDAVAYCPHLLAFIETKDKTPLIDGHIAVYTQTGHNNDHYHGRVDVQVKGRQRTAKKNLAKYPIRRAELLKHQATRGILYLVVTINPTTRKRKPYYALLSPVAIAQLIDNGPPEASELRVPVKPFPAETAAIEALMFHAIETQKEDLRTTFNDQHVERLRGFQLSAATEQALDQPITFIAGVGDVSIVAHTTDGLALTFIGELTLLPPGYQYTKRDITTASGEISYPSAHVRRLDHERSEVKLSDGLSLIFTQTGAKLTSDVTVAPAGNLPQRLRDLEFMDAMVTTQALTVGDMTLPFEVTREHTDPETIEYLDWLRILSELLEHLHVDTTLVNPDSVTNAQASALHAAHAWMIRGQKPDHIPDPPTFLELSVGPWCLLLLIARDPETDETVMVNPYDGQPHGYFARGSDTERVLVTPYDVSADGSLAATLNLNLPRIVDAYQSIAGDSQNPSAASASTESVAENRMLELIAGADATPERASEFLTAAEQLNNWLTERYPANVRGRINAWQITARQRDLTQRERDDIRELRRTLVADGQDLQAEMACAILLKDAEEADQLERKLGETALSFMQSWPIWTLRTRLLKAE